MGRVHAIGKRAEVVVEEPGVDVEGHRPGGVPEQSLVCFPAGQVFQLGYRCRQVRGLARQGLCLASWKLSPWQSRCTKPMCGSRFALLTRVNDGRKLTL